MFGNGTLKKSILEDDLLRDMATADCSNVQLRKYVEGENRQEEIQVKDPEGRLIGIVDSSGSWIIG